jgi:hypothetical protein
MRKLFRGVHIRSGLCGFDLDLTKLTECVGVDWPEQGVGREIVLEVVERVVFLELFSRVLT